MAYITCRYGNICSTEYLFMCPECFNEIEAKSNPALDALMEQPDHWLDPWD